MKNKKLYLVSGLILLGLGVSGCQNTSTSSTSSSTTQSSKSSKSNLPSLTKDSSSSQENDSSSQESNSAVSQSSESSSMQKNSENKSENSTQVSKTNLPGVEGLYSIPAQYQGTWYGYDSEGNEQKITFDGSKIITEYGATELHKVDTDKLPTTPTQKQITEGAHYGRALPVTIDGINYLNVRSYFQGAGAGGYYGAHTEKGQSVIISASGAGAWADCVYWKSPELAKQYKDEKFDDLHYIESGDND